MRTFFILIIFLISSLIAFEYRNNQSSFVASIAGDKKGEKIQGDKAFVEFAKSIKLDLNTQSVYLLNFWASWCSPCLRELPGLNRFETIYKDKGVKILSVNGDYEDQEKVIRKTIKDFGLSFKIYPDNKNKIISSFKITGLPVTMIFKGTKLVDKILGEVDFDSSSFHKKIDQLLKYDGEN